MLRLISAIGGDFEGFEELRQDYLSNAPDLVAKLRNASVVQDWTAVRIAAHTLKSNARDFGATHLSNLCETLEKQCKDGVPQNLELAIHEIESFERLSSAAIATIRPDDLV